MSLSNKILKIHSNVRPFQEHTSTFCYSLIKIGADFGLRAAIFVAASKLDRQKNPSYDHEMYDSWRFR